MGWWDNKKSTDILGDTHFIVFYGCILARLAYTNDNHFFEYYKKIFGPIIPIEFMKQMDSVSHTELHKYYEDETIFQLNTPTKLQVGVELKTVDHTYTDKGFKGTTKKLIDIVGMNFAANIDALLEEVPSYQKVDYKELKKIEEPIQTEQDPNERTDIRYISIATSNYGEIYIVADKRTPHTLYIAFRGTYSAKTAGIYLQMNTFEPYEVKNGDGFLLGMYKTIIEVFHTIVEAMVEMSKFLGATQPIKIFTTGHSLGAGLATIFSYLWQHFSSHEQYKDARYKVFSPNIICLSYGSPRVFNPQAASKFCEYATSYGPGKPLKIFYERVVSKGDPVAGMPKKSFLVVHRGIIARYEHPCSMNPELRTEISEECENTVHREYTSGDMMSIGTNDSIECKDESGGFTVALSPLDHVGYMGLSFKKAVDLKDIFSFKNATATNTLEVKRENEDTVCRLVMWNGTNYVMVFFNLAKLRIEKSKQNYYNIGKDRKPLEDVKMSPELFSELIKNMKPSTMKKIDKKTKTEIDGTIDLSPTDWVGPTPTGYLYTPSSYREMPQLEYGKVVESTDQKTVQSTNISTSQLTDKSTGQYISSYHPAYQRSYQPVGGRKSKKSKKHKQKKRKTRKLRKM